MSVSVRVCACIIRTSSLISLFRLFRHLRLLPCHTTHHATLHTDYNDLLDMTEKMVSDLVLSIKGTYVIEYAAEEGTLPYNTLQS